MVLSDYGDRHRVDPASQSPVQWRLAVLAVSHHLLLEYRPLYHLPRHLSPPIHHVPRSIHVHDPAPSAISLPGHITHGSLNNNQHDCICLRARMGTTRNHTSLDPLVDRRCHLGRKLFLAPFRNHVHP